MFLLSSELYSFPRNCTPFHGSSLCVLHGYAVLLFSRRIRFSGDLGDRMFPEDGFRRIFVIGNIYVIILSRNENYIQIFKIHYFAFHGCKMKIFVQ